LGQWRTKLERTYGRTLTLVESWRYWIVAGVLVLSCIAARFCTPYPQAVAQDLLLLAATIFSIFFLAYVFLRDRLQSQVNFVEQEIGEIDQHWNVKKYEFAREAAKLYEREYRLAFLFILSAECLLLVSIFLLIYTVFVGTCWWVETVGLGLIMSALILLILMLILHHGYPGPEGLFSKLKSYLETVRTKHQRAGLQRASKKGPSK